ncbi:MAG: magnesium-protoporphyrin IX monomethyl ester cyclase, partial [Trichodesmium sp. MAG_R04]|nr:magnesium-protoporphyrin IX monomethyl ester cyclase [Trichodesmium sp. MAG_R04]
VIDKTNETSGRVFPVILDVEDPEFYERLEVCVKNNEKLTVIANSNQPGFMKFFQKLPLYISNGWQFLKLYFMKPIETATMQSSVR